jgi:uncharacterized protein
MTSPYAFPDARILLFAKTPRKGHVKTRLQPLLGEQGACDLHAALIRYCWRQLLADQVAQPELWVSECDVSRFFDTLRASHEYHVQQGECLGARMNHAISQALRSASYVLVVGADCPAVDSAYLIDALGRLRQGVPVVLGPAEDGGYVLVGMSDPHEHMFQNIAWGTDQVMIQTRARLQESGTKWIELPPCWDVDRPEDLSRLAALPGWPCQE